MNETPVESTPDQQDPPVNRVTLRHPWRWLEKGWLDIRAAPLYSLRYGAGIVILSASIVLLTLLGRLSFLLPFLTAGFFLMAPLLAIGLYRMSDHLERGEPLAHCQVLEAIKRNQGQLGIATGFLLIIMQLWILASVFLFIMLYQDPFPTWNNFISTVVLSGEHRPLVIAVVLVGAFFAACAFCVSAITIPMLIDRPVDGFTAMRTSVRAVAQNWLPMLLWAALLVAIVGTGLLTFYLGLFLAVPLVGHATWHAYRDLVPRAD
ncbi:Protein of unknown function DUF2189, transmembrane [Thiorhodococcus drewsii AZ1]|uniref:Integral membrane protein n=1 Tax=Thiorhodococcus drewsii AZ1 TaxID=765913 RepID=G2E6V7_9GAMM|nr:DUF2189 domain-containing protein [Thiorhodococcus drewsii]EGV28185.1 Protein of unknown function DUF2189, transmembrane [Thiorhodococcus drewsii AZ1]